MKNMGCNWRSGREKDSIFKHDGARLYNKCIQQRSASAPNHIRLLTATASHGSEHTYELTISSRTPPPRI